MNASHHLDADVQIQGLPPVRDYIKCMEKNRIAAEKCSPMLVDACRNKTFTAMKILRLQVPLIEKLYKMMPNLKVLYQMRDPRGIVLSRRDTWSGYVLTFKNNITKEAEFLCKKMVTDFKEIRKLKSNYPGLVYVTRYEDVSERPVDVLRDIYHHTGLPNNTKINQWLSKEANKSSKISKAWSKKITPEVKASIDSVCQEFYDLAGYTV